MTKTGRENRRAPVAHGDAHFVPEERPMADTTRPEDRQREQARPAAPEGDAAAERGERIATGKDIARGGKRSGEVPGATPSPPGAGDNG